MKNLYYITIFFILLKAASAYSQESEFSFIGADFGTGFFDSKHISPISNVNYLFGKNFFYLKLNTGIAHSEEFNNIFNAGIKICFDTKNTTYVTVTEVALLTSPTFCNPS